MREPPSIDAWGGGGFRVSGVWHSGSLLLLDDTPLSWPPARLDDLRPSDFAAVIAAGPAASEFVLLGTGLASGLPARAVRDAIEVAGFGLEFMATEAAARLYNVLVSEGRRFAAALIAV
ncbi:MAG: Mth938-like domain-containing protein [Caulobacteraceae bacterium]